MLRDPVIRYISEWRLGLKKYIFIFIFKKILFIFLCKYRHIQRHNVGWNKVLNNYCNKENLMTSCYSFKEAGNVTFEDFMSCTGNMANNRLTRMLANYKNDCAIYKPENKRILLDNAKQVLSELAFFGLTEYVGKLTFFF